MSKIILVSPQLGSGNDLLYWEPILFNLIDMYNHEVSVCTTGEIDKKKSLITQSLQVKFTSFLGLKLPSIKTIKHLWSMDYDVAFLVEFNVLSLLVLLINQFKKKRKSVLLVENSPVFLNGINKNRINLIFTLFRRFCCVISDMVLTTNQFGYDYLTNKVKVAKSKIIIGPYLTSSFKNNAKCQVGCHEKIRFVAAGRLVKEKGFEFLINEIQSLPIDIIKNLVFDIYGEGDYRATLERQIRKYNLSHIVRLKGLVPYKNLGILLSDYDCFIMPTLGDYRSLVSFEAISLGLPIILSKYDGSNSEVLVDGVNGFCIDPLDVGSISSKIRYIVKNPDTLRKMSAASRKVSNRFTLEKSSLIFNNAINLVLK